ncbi:hypothetical protein OUZ56_010597 [Daphnia magna]|uniref:Uncharacterized protein n=1 Tax=Daphnia magna TaxID=35525 RepID=A0ABR0AJ03_9CRUS|nr:hypothetical protein OUZ56_010597 [Daphnia magna]
MKIKTKSSTERMLEKKRPKKQINSCVCACAIFECQEDIRSPGKYESLPGLVPCISPVRL